MILVNRNFGNPALSQAIGDMFKPTTNDDLLIDWINHTNALATSSSLVSTVKNAELSTTTTGDSSIKTVAENNYVVPHQNYNISPKNIFIVTEHFLKVLDKVYTKIWNESFTETAIYTSDNLATIFNGFVTDTSNGSNSLITEKYPVNFMMFKKFVDRAITAGILLEEDRLDYQDQVTLKELSKTNLSTQVDLDTKLITFTCSEPVDVAPDINAQEGSYLYGKKLYLMMTPYLTNESVIKNRISTSNGVWSEPVSNFKVVTWTYNSKNTYSKSGVSIDAPVHRPIAFFKPKTPESKFGRSLPLATHFIWRIGTPEQKEMALLEGTEVPEIIFDHLDRISHIDSFVLKIKFDKLQF